MRWREGSDVVAGIEGEGEVKGVSIWYGIKRAPRVRRGLRGVIADRERAKANERGRDMGREGVA